MLRNFFRFSTSKKTLYELLGVSQNATQAEIKKKFHELAKKYHPDSSTSTKDKEV